MKTFLDVARNVLEKKADTPWLTVISGEKESSFTIAALTQRICDFYRYYQDKGVQPSDTILIILKESLDLYAAFFAGIILGALPAFFAYPSHKQKKEVFLASIDNLLRYNQIRLVVGFEEVIEILKNNSSIEQKDFLGFAAISEAGPGIGPELSQIPKCKHESFLQFSSGTTGAKKGVQISVEALFNQTDAYSRFVRFNNNSSIASWLPHYHDMGLISCMLMPFLHAVPVFMMSPFEWVDNPSLLLETITRHQCTHTWQPNFALGHMTRNIADKDLPKFNLRSLQQITICSEPALQPTVTGFLDKFSACGVRPEIFANCYAMAENTFAMTSTIPGDFGFVEIDPQVLRSENRIAPHKGGRIIASAGVPLPNINIRIADEEGNDIREDKVGEVLIKSDCMLEQYHNNPEATAKAFSNGFFKTGDLGFIYENQLYIVGRRKDMIIINGENIYPQDIELLLNEEESLIPGRNVVFGIDDERRGTESIIVLAEVKSGCEKIDTTALRAKIFNLLNVSIADILLLPHMVLRKGTAGKISRFLNKEAYLAGEFNSCLDSKTKTEDGLKDLVLGVLRDSLRSIDAIDEQTQLFSTGLIDSLGTQELILAIQNKFNVIMPTYAFWGNNDQHIDTLADIRKWIGLNCRIFDNNEVYKQLNLPKVVAGKDNYLFYFQEIQYYWQPPYTNDELASIRRILEERRNWLAARDIEYLFMIVPNKASIYPEYLPDNIRSKTDQNPSRYDQLIDYLKNHSDLNVLDLKEILLSVKNDVPLYYRTDTHYNKLAVCYVSNGIIRFLQDRFPFCRKYKGSVYYKPLANIPYKGDMARLLQVEGESIERNGFEILGSYRNRIRTAEQHLFVNEADDAPPLNLMLLGDSFGRALEGSILDQFAKKTYYAAPTDNQQANMPIDTALIDRFQPSVVVNEIIERFLVFKFLPNVKPVTDAAEYMPPLPKYQSFSGYWPVEIKPAIQETTV